MEFVVPVKHTCASSSSSAAATLEPAQTVDDEFHPMLLRCIAKKQHRLTVNLMFVVLKVVELLIGRVYGVIVHLPETRIIMWYKNHQYQ